MSLLELVIETFIRFPVFSTIVAVLIIAWLVVVIRGIIAAKRLL